MVFSKYLNWNSDWWQRHLLLPGKNQENWHWLHCWEGNYSCDKICKPMHYAYNVEWISLHWLLIGKSKPYWCWSHLLSHHKINTSLLILKFCLESGCIRKYTHLGPRDFPRVGILHPSALEIALAPFFSRPALIKNFGPSRSKHTTKLTNPSWLASDHWHWEVFFQMHPMLLRMHFWSQLEDSQKSFFTNACIVTTHALL